MKNNRGEILVNETLKIILSVIAIGFLVFFLTSLYFAKVYDEKFIAATNTLMQIEITLGVSGGEVNALTPKGWNLYSFVRGNAEDRPNSCAGNSCLCICDDVSWYDFKSQKDKCEKDGACLIVDGLIEFNSIEIKKELTNIEIIKEGDQVRVNKK